jgi:hypothetical protein
MSRQCPFRFQSYPLWSRGKKGSAPIPLKAKPPPMPGGTPGKPESERPDQASPGAGAFVTYTIQRAAQGKNFPSWREGREEQGMGQGKMALSREEAGRLSFVGARDSPFVSSGRRGWEGGEPGRAARQTRPRCFFSGPSNKKRSGRVPAVK